MLNNDAAAPLASSSVHLDAALRALYSPPRSVNEHSVAEARRKLSTLFGSLASRRPQTIHRVVIADDARWFQVDGETPVSLQTRPTLRRILLALFDARCREPGVALDLRALMALGWPGEAMLASAALNRVKVAITTLRKLGLGVALLRAREGWLFDPGVAVMPPTQALAGARERGVPSLTGTSVSMT
jgi:hypothetical protein